MIDVTDLIKAYNKVIVLNVPKLHMQAGQSIGLVGNNGAGKTTLFSLVLDIIKADRGSVLSKSVNVKMSDHWKDYTGAYLDDSFLIEFLTPEEYFEFIGQLHGLNKTDVANRITEYSEFFNDEILGQKKLIRELSKGNQKKVGIIGALLPQPEILVLDEPFPHLDPSSVIRLKRLLRDLSSKGVTLLISSHDLNHVTEICNRIVLLEKGVIISDQETSENTLRELEKYFSSSSSL